MIAFLTGERKYDRIDGMLLSLWTKKLFAAADINGEQIVNMNGLKGSCWQKG